MFELISLFSFFGLLFYFIVPAIIIGISLSNEHLGFAYLAVIGSILGIFILSDVKILLVLHWIFSHPLQVVIIVAAYVFCAIVWSLIKWRTLSRDARAEYDLRRAGWFDRYQTQNTESYRQTTSFKEWTRKVYDMPPSPLDHVDKINVWMAFWPFSVVGTVFGDYLYRFFKWVSKFFTGLYIQITQAAFKGTDLQ